MARDNALRTVRQIEYEWIELSDGDERQVFAKTWRHEAPRDFV